MITLLICGIFNARVLASCSEELTLLCTTPDEQSTCFERALEGREKALGPEHTSTLGTVNNLGILYKDQGKLAERTSTLSKVRAFFTKLRVRWRRRMSKGKRRS